VTTAPFSTVSTLLWRQRLVLSVRVCARCCHFVVSVQPRQPFHHIFAEWNKGTAPGSGRWDKAMAADMHAFCRHVSLTTHSPGTLIYRENDGTGPCDQRSPVSDSATKLYASCDCVVLRCPVAC
jgi:hypothetical protein